MSLIDILKPAPAVVTAATPGRVHHIAAPEEDHDLQLTDALPPRPVRFQTVARDVPINRAGEGETMPKGVYKRKKKTEGGTDAAPGAAAAPAAGKKHKTRARAAPVKAARTPRQVEPRFAVFTDGSVLIDAPGCSGTLSGPDAKVLVAFISRLKGE